MVEELDTAVEFLGELPGEHKDQNLITVYTYRTEVLKSSIRVNPKIEMHEINGFKRLAGGESKLCSFLTDLENELLACNGQDICKLLQEMYI